MIEDVEYTSCQKCGNEIIATKSNVCIKCFDKKDEDQDIVDYIELNQLGSRPIRVGTSWKI